MAERHTDGAPTRTLVSASSPQGESPQRHRAPLQWYPLIVLGTLLVALAVAFLPFVGWSDFGSDVISMAILIGALAFARGLDRRSGAIIALLAGAIAAIIPGVPAFPPRSMGEVALRLGAFVLMAVVYYQVIVALRNRDARVQRQLDGLHMLHGEVRALHAAVIQLPVDSAAIDTQIARSAFRLVGGRRSRLVRRQPDTGGGAVVTQWPPVAWGDGDENELCAVVPPLDAGYVMTRTQAGDERITVALARDHACAATLQVECHGSDRESAEHAALLAVYARDASLALEHLALRARMERLIRLEERGRIARALHDGLVQSLGGIAFRMEYCSAILAPDTVDSVREQLDTTGEAVRTALREARLMIHSLRTPAPPGDVCARLRALADDLAGESDVVVAVDLPATAPMVPAAQTDTICLVAREALRNVAKHARVGRAGLALRAEAQRIALTISDDGCGFDARDGTGEHSLRYGLLGMAERAAHHGGTVTIRTAPGMGTCVTLALPIEEVDEWQSASCSPTITD